MAVDESVQEILLKLAFYEELSKSCYTEKDEGYRQTAQRPLRYFVSPDWCAMVSCACKAVLCVYHIVFMVLYWSILRIYLSLVIRHEFD